MGSCTLYSLVLVMTTWSLSVFVALSSVGLCGKPLQPSLTSLLIAVVAVTVTDCCANDCVVVVGSKRVTRGRQVLEGPLLYP